MTDTAAPRLSGFAIDPGRSADTEPASRGAPRVARGQHSDPLAERHTRGTRMIVSAGALTLGALVTLVFLMFLLIEPTPRWLVLLGAVASVPALDGVLRAARREPFEEGGADTAPWLVVPALAVLVTPVFLEHNARGYWAVPAGLLAGGTYTLLVVSTVSSVREHDRGRAFGRFVSAAVTYFLAFAVFSLVYRFEVAQRPATVAVGLASMLLGADLLREEGTTPAEVTVLAAAIGLLVAETRWTLHFLPVEGYTAGLTLLLAFYFAAGVLHAQLNAQLSRAVLLEYSMVGVAGLTFIIAARMAGLA